MNVGVLANPTVARWQERALERIDALDGVDLTYVVVDASVGEGSSLIDTGSEVVNQGRTITGADFRLFFEVLRKRRLKVFIYADQKLGWMLFGETNQLDNWRSRPVASVDPLSGAEFEECTPVDAGGAWNELPERVVDEVEARCDVVVRFAFGLVKGRILTAPEHGVLSAHGSDIRRYRGMGPKLTFYLGEETATVTLQQLTQEIDGGRIVEMMSRDLPEVYTLDDVLGAVYDLQTEIFAAGIDNLRDPEFAPTRPDELGEYVSHDLQERNAGFVAKLVLKNNWARLRKAVRG